MKFFRKLKHLAAILPVLLVMVVLSTATYCADTIPSHSADMGMRIFEYKEIVVASPQVKEDITQELFTKGYMAVRGVEGFWETYEAFLEAARKFDALPEDQKKKCTPPNPNAVGWSDGIESFNGVRDELKGSYYARIPEENHPENIWPETLPEFRTAYIKLLKLTSKVGNDILPLLGFEFKTKTLGRMLRYLPDVKKEGDNERSCGKHCDHGLWTVLCPEIFEILGKIVDKPVGSGLYVEGKSVSAPKDVLIFQVGEWMELLSNGKFKATEHWVNKTYGDIVRWAVATFIDPIQGDMKLPELKPDIVTKYQERLAYMKDKNSLKDVTFMDWHWASLKKYSPAPQENSSNQN